ncbi:hypothetical protein, partial [Corynebacterium sp. HMSC078H07]|uniref:hypothetical protein n=1 Tax=Corynebacterium sp. HMSC078H07 TaxID=1739379 RepID=UPI001AEFB80B
STKKAVKSPNLTKRQTTTNNTTNAASPELAIQKLHKENKLQPTPNPTGHKNKGWPSQKKIINTPKQLKMFTMTPLEKSAIRHTPTVPYIRHNTANNDYNQPTQKSTLAHY